MVPIADFPPFITSSCETPGEELRLALRKRSNVDIHGFVLCTNREGKKWRSVVMSQLSPYIYLWPQNLFYVFACKI